MKSTSVSIIIFSLLIFIIERLFLNNDEEFTRFMEFQLVVIWGFALYSSYKKFGLFSLYSLCLVGMFIFAIGGIFHFLVTGDDIRHVERGFGNHSFSYRTIQEALWAYSVFILLSYVVYDYLFHKSSKKISNIRFYCNEKLFFIGKILMWSFLAIQIYKGYLYFNAFNANRVEIFLLGNMANPVPTWVRFFAYFFEIGYYFVLASVPKESKFKRYSLLYFIVLIPEILLGNRGMFGAFALFYLWYNYTFFGKTVLKTRTAIIMGCIMLVIFQLMEFIRDGASYDITSISPTKFLVSQGISFYILPIYIDYINNVSYYLYPFFLYNILSGFTGYTGQSIDVLQHNCGVGHQLMYAVDPNYYLAGASFGSSSITEIYDAGIVGFMFFSIFFSVMIRFFERKFLTNMFIRFTCLVLVSHFILSSRGSYFPSLYAFLKLFIFYHLIIFFMNTFILKKNNLHRSKIEKPL